MARWVLGLLLVLSSAALIPWALRRGEELSAARNIVLYRLEKKWEAVFGPVEFSVPLKGGSEPGGALAGTIRDKAGRPLAGAVALVAGPTGVTYAARSGPDGRYRIAPVPPGYYLPVAAKGGYHDAVYRWPLLGLRRDVRVRPGFEVGGVNFWLQPAPRRRGQADDSLRLGVVEMTWTALPEPKEARRRTFSFSRAGQSVEGGLVYEPVEGEGPFPTLLVIYPDAALNWDVVSAAVAAQGYVIVAVAPVHGLHLEEDVDDLLKVVAFIKDGRLSPLADGQRLGLMAGSFTSLHAYRLAQTSPDIDAVLILGGISDAFLFRRAFEEGKVFLQPPLDSIVIGLGRPTLQSEVYLRYSAAYHLEGLPPLSIIHGESDETVPYDQALSFAQALAASDVEHEVYLYLGLKHYFLEQYFREGTPDPITLDMFAVTLDFFARRLNIPEEDR
ncbi:MAG: carboxypeptidase regulatory-like domain-containing protein [Anaerolineae bacterium]